MEAKSTHVQNSSLVWKNYNGKRVIRDAAFLRLLSSLAEGIAQPEERSGYCCEHHVPLADALVHGALAAANSQTPLRAMHDVMMAVDMGLIGGPAAPNAVLRVLHAPDTVPVLLRLIDESTRSLRELETDFVVDATTISVGRHAPLESLKLHIMVGVRTGVITAAQVTPADILDGCLLPSLIRTTVKKFKVERVAADAAYCTRHNLHKIVDVGAEPFVPFKAMSTMGVDNLWNRLRAYYIHSNDAFMARFRVSERACARVKRSLGGHVNAASCDGQAAEIYLKVLVHNIRTLVRATFDLGILPSFWASAPMPPEAES